jgi:integrase/recombinase XerD
VPSRCAASSAGWRPAGVHELGTVRTHHVSAYVEVLTRSYKAPTVKQHLASIRMLFDWLIVGQVVGQNPAAAVRGPKHVVKKGQTPVLDGDEARKLLGSIDTSTVVGLRDRALIALLIYTFARISAALHMNVEDYYPQGKRWWVRLHEKAASSTRCRPTICWRPTSTPMSPPPASARTGPLRCSARSVAVAASSSV